MGLAPPGRVEDLTFPLRLKFFVKIHETVESAQQWGLELSNGGIPTAA